MFALMHMDYRQLREPAVVYTVCVVCMLLVGTFFLDKSHATHRWIKWPCGIQPSELAKLAVILYLAWFLDQKRRAASSMEFCKEDFLQTILPAAGPMLVCVFLIVLQPDLGIAVDIVIVYRDFVCRRPVLEMARRWNRSGHARAFLFAYPRFLPQRPHYRVSSSGIDPQGAGFQLLQSLIAVGSGGFTGVGLMESKQKLFYLPEAHTDFIYAVICEELGFIGAAIIIALFAAYAWRGLRASFNAPDGFGRMLALGATAMVLFQALINFAVVLGMMPTKGIPLPFVSYGGSSLLVMLLATGVLLNVAQQGSSNAGLQA